MRILLVGAGAAVSTKDVENGFFSAFKQLGVDVYLYDLGSRLTLSKRVVDAHWKWKGKDPLQRPSWADTLYLGGLFTLDMALEFEVDWVFYVSAMYVQKDALRRMRSAGQRTAILFTESPYEDDMQAEWARVVDACWTTERTSVEVLRRANPNTFFVGHAYDPARHVSSPDVGVDEHSPDLENTPAHDVVFVGTGFIERIRLLEQVDWSGIDLGLYGGWTLLSSRHRLRRFVRSSYLDNSRTIELYRKAKIGLNLYRSSLTYGKSVPHIYGAECLNPRAYELAACGVFQLSDSRPEVDEIFGSSVPTFSGPRSLQAQIRAYLDDPSARRQHAAVARQRVSPHTFSVRAEKILADLEQLARRPLAKGAA